jgi:hypothetical protein
VHVSQQREPGRVAHFRQRPEPGRDAWPAGGARIRAIRFVEARLKDHAARQQVREAGEMLGDASIQII